MGRTSNRIHSGDSTSAALGSGSTFIDVCGLQLDQMRQEFYLKTNCYSLPHTDKQVFDIWSDHLMKHLNSTLTFIKNPYKERKLQNQDLQNCTLEQCSKRAKFQDRNGSYWCEQHAVSRGKFKNNRIVLNS